MLINGVKVGSESQPQSSVSRFFEQRYGIPQSEMRAGMLTVRFEATNGLEVTPVFGVRLVRA